MLAVVLRCLDDDDDDDDGLDTLAASCFLTDWSMFV